MSELTSIAFKILLTQIMCGTCQPTLALVEDFAHEHNVFLYPPYGLRGRCFRDEGCDVCDS